MKIYSVVEDSVIDFADIVNVHGTYKSKEDAIAKMQELWKDLDGSVEFNDTEYEDTPTSLCKYEDGNFVINHCRLSVIESELDLD